MNRQNNAHREPEESLASRWTFSASCSSLESAYPTWIGLTLSSLTWFNLKYFLDSSVHQFHLLLSSTLSRLLACTSRTICSPHQFRSASSLWLLRRVQWSARYLNFSYSNGKSHSRFVLSVLQNSLCEKHRRISASESPSVAYHKANHKSHASESHDIQLVC